MIYRPCGVPTNVEGRMGITAEQYRAHQDAGGKWCSGCQDWHPLAQFNGSTHAVDGLQVQCRERQRHYRLRSKQ